MQHKHNEYIENNRSIENDDFRLAYAPCFIPPSHHHASNAPKQREQQRSTSSLPRSPSTTQFSNTQSSIHIFPDNHRHNSIKHLNSSSSSSSTSTVKWRKKYNPDVAALVAVLITGVSLFCAAYDENRGWRDDFCVPKWEKTSRVETKCIDRNSVCHTPQQSTESRCVPLKTLGQGESCWTSFDQCQEGLYCQVSLPSWSRDLYYKMALAVNHIDPWALSPVLSHSIPYQCLLWQLHDIAQLMQRERPFQDAWMVAKCSSINETGFIGTDTGLEVPIKTQLPRSLLSQCSFLDVPYTIEFDQLEQIRRLKNSTCFPWDMRDPNTKECQTLAEIPCQGDFDCMIIADKRIYPLTEELLCDVPNNRCYNEFKQPCMAEFNDFQREWEFLRDLMEFGPLHDNIGDLYNFVKSSKSFVCCLSNLAKAMTNYLEHSEEVVENLHTTTLGHDLPRPEFCKEDPRAVEVLIGHLRSFQKPLKLEFMEDFAKLGKDSKWKPPLLIGNE